MRVLYPVLVAATIGCIIWCLALYAMLPVGTVDKFHGVIKNPLFEHDAAIEDLRVLPQMIQTIVDGIRSAVVATAVPLLLTNFGWMYLAYRMLRKAGEF